MGAKALTDGEIRVLKTYIDQQTHAAAASELEISTQTLKNHLGSIYRKLGVRKAHAAVYEYARMKGCDPFVDTATAETVESATG